MKKPLSFSMRGWDVVNAAQINHPLPSSFGSSGQALAKEGSNSSDTIFFDFVSVRYKCVILVFHILGFSSINQFLVMKTIRIAVVLALSAMTIGCFSKVSAQTYKRHALIEEGTGTWCGYCPYGAFTVDSMSAHMGDNLVAISWHGPYNYGEPLYMTGKNQNGTQAMDTLASFDSITGYPWASLGRDEVGAAFSGAYVQNGNVIFPNGWYTTAQTQARQAPLVDFRIVNATYSGNSIDFDLDITPFDLSMMPTEDIATYVTVAVLTEDGPQTTQDIYEQSYTTIDNFVNYNLAREVGGKGL